MVICPACRSENEEGRDICSECGVDFASLLRIGVSRLKRNTEKEPKDKAVLDFDEEPARPPRAMFKLVSGWLAILAIIFVLSMFVFNLFPSGKPEKPVVPVWDGRALKVAEALNDIHTRGCEVWIEYGASADEKPTKLHNKIKEATHKANNLKGLYIIGAAYHVGPAPKNSKLRVYEDGIAKKPTWVGTLIIIHCRPGLSAAGV